MPFLSGKINYVEYKPLIYFPEKLRNIPLKHIERALMIGAIACAIISLIPSTGMVGALALRSISCGSISIHLLTSLKNREGKGMLFFHIVRLASLSLGLAGLAAQVNLLILASIGFSLALHPTLLGMGVKKKDHFQTFVHLEHFLVDTCILIGMLTGSSSLIFTACLIHSVVMLSFSAKELTLILERKDRSAAIEFAVYFILCTLGIFSALTSLRSEMLFKESAKKHHYFYENSSHKVVNIYDKHHNVIAKVEPGKSVTFSLDPKNTRHGIIYYSSHNSPRGGEERIFPHSSEWSEPPGPMTKAEFATLPIGSSAVGSELPRSKKIAPFSYEIESEELDELIASKEPPYVSCSIIDEEQPQIIFKKKGDRIGRRFDFERVCGCSEFIKGWKDWDQVEGTAEIELDVDKDTYEYLMRFFEIGISQEEMEAFKEKELIRLVNVADFLGIVPLLDLCKKEIALRLKMRKWANTSLLDSSLNALSPIVSLFNFAPSRLYAFYHSVV
ncbi:MAG: hypothetical protein JJU12_02980 [Chlamydiales bacterium]|nr:hypothetical protein [Chlamydiales bacterium]